MIMISPYIHQLFNMFQVNLFQDSPVFCSEMIGFVKKKKVPYTLTSIAPNWCYITAVWVAKIDLAD